MTFSITAFVMMMSQILYAYNKVHVETSFAGFRTEQSGFVSLFHKKLILRNRMCQVSDEGPINAIFEYSNKHRTRTLQKQAV